MNTRNSEVEGQSGLFRDIIADLTSLLQIERRAMTLKNVIWLVCGPDAFMILLTFRLREWARRWHIPLLNRLLRLWQTVVYGIELGNDIQLGHGVYFVHPIGVVVGGHSTVGHRCVFYGSNTVGTATGGGEPFLAERVEIGCGARLLGPITIGAEARIGANAVVLNDVPAKMLAVGVPARLI